MSADAFSIAGLAHALACLSAPQRVCVVTRSAEETLRTIAGLVRASDPDRDRFVIRISPEMDDALRALLGEAGIDLSASVASGRLTLCATDRRRCDAAASVADLRAALGGPRRPDGRRFAIVSIHDQCGGENAADIAEFLRLLDESIGEIDAVVASVFDLSSIDGAIVRDAVYAHRYVISHGVLGENMHYLPPRDLAAAHDSTLDVEDLLDTLDDEACTEAPSGALRDEDGVGRRLSEVNAALQKEIADRVRMECELVSSEERYRLLVEALPECVFVHSEGAIVFVNQAALDMVGAASPEEVLGRSVMSFVHPDSLATVSARVQMMMQEGLRAPMMTERFLRLDGSAFFAEAIATPLVYDGKPSIQVVMRDISEQRAAQAELEFKSFLADHAIDGILVRRVEDRKIIYVNDALCALMGATRERLVGRSVRGFIAPDSLDSVDRHVASVEKYGSGMFETVLQNASGEQAPVEVHSVLVPYGDDHVIVSLVRDIAMRRHAEEALEHATVHDALTGLPSRALFNDRLEHAVAAATRNCRPMALLFMDIDMFKTVNDSLGHSVGDELLVAVAQRVQGVVRAVDTVARRGGDEYHIILTELSGPEDAAGAAEKILSSIRVPFDIGGHEIHISASLGVAMHGGDGDMSAATLIRNADMAMYSAKEGGRDSVSFFDPSMSAVATERYELANELRSAVGRGEIEVYYQPIVALSDGRIIGAEALCRWLHPERGMVLPATFIPVAEESGSIVPIGEWVLRQACHEVRRWQERDHGHLVVSVNLSPYQLHTIDLESLVNDAVDTAGIPADRLQLEITESSAMENVAHTIRLFESLARRGVRLAIDDFGTGYSSLAYLRRFPVHTIKLDRTFVRDFGLDPATTAVAASIILLADALGINVVAEGVETMQQRDALLSQSCLYSQGHLFSRAVPADRFLELLDLPNLWPGGDPDSRAV